MSHNGYCVSTTYNLELELLDYLNVDSDARTNVFSAIYY